MNRPPHDGRDIVVPVTERREKLYAAERRFDITTLLTITTGYAVLFTVMRLFQWNAVWFAMVAAFATFVGLGQAFLFEGKSPRVASALVGGVYWSVLAIVWDETSSVGGVVIGGALAGYACGVLVGGVFMLGDFLRQRIAWLGKQPDGEAHGDILTKD